MVQILKNRESEKAEKDKKETQGPNP